MIAILVLVWLLVSCADGQAAKTPTPVAVFTPMPPIAVWVETIGIARLDVFVDGLGLAWEPENTEDEFLVVYLRLPPAIPIHATNEWFEDGGTHGPKVFDGERKSDWLMVWLVEKKVLALVFVISREAEKLVLWLPGKVSVDLTAVPDVSPVEERPTTVPSNPPGHLRK